MSTIERVATAVIVGAVLQSMILHFMHPFALGSFLLFPLCVVGGVVLWKRPLVAEFLFWAGCAAAAVLLLGQERLVSSGLS